MSFPWSLEKSWASFDPCRSTQSSAFIKLWPLRRCSAVIRLFAALTTMGGNLASRQIQINSRKRDERESFPNFPPPAPSRHSCLMNANLCWKIWEDSLILFLCRALAGLTPSQERFSSSWSLCYLLTHLFITFLFTMNKVKILEPVVYFHGDGRVLIVW